MARTIKGNKGCGYEFWGKRALSQCPPGRYSKKLTHGIERMQARQLIHVELKQHQ